MELLRGLLTRARAFVLADIRLPVQAVGDDLAPARPLVQTRRARLRGGLQEGRRRRIEADAETVTSSYVEHTLS